MNDNSIDITTSQNVVINYQIANLGDRIMAFIFDLVIIAGYSIIIAVLCFDTLKIPHHFAWMVFIFYLPVIFYTLLFETAMNGQTPGKKWRKLKVVKMDGGQASIGAYLIRWLFRIVEIYSFYGVIAMLTITISKKKQRVGDMLAQTVVINVQDRVSLMDTVYEKIESDYQVQYEGVKKLSEDDIELIKKVLNTPEYLDNFEMVLSLTQKIQEKMGLTGRNEGPEDFLKTVTRDYNYLCGV